MQELFCVLAVILLFLLTSDPSPNYTHVGCLPETTLKGPPYYKGPWIY